LRRRTAQPEPKSEFPFGAGRLQRKRSGEGVPAAVEGVVRSPGQPLDAATQASMERRFGHDFSSVRVHTGAQAEDSARAVDARAYTVGRSIVFGAGSYQPATAPGRWLLAHELTHVVQQGGTRGQGELSLGDPRGAGEHEADRSADAVARGAAPGPVAASPSAAPVVQRVGIWQSIKRFFGGGTFEVPELKAYLKSLEDNHKIENHYDSDNKARDVVRRFKKGEPDFAILTVPMRALLIEEMIDGHVSEADQEATMDLLREAIVGERTFILQKVGIAKLRSALDGADLKELNALIGQEEDDVAIESMGKWTAEGVMKIVFRHGDARVIDFLIREGFAVLSFAKAFDKWEYPDGRTEETLIPGLLGNTCSVVRLGCPRPKEIRLNEALRDAEASATLAHEVAHAEKKASEEDARVEGEKFRIRHGMGPQEPDYRKPDGTINEAAIRKEVTASPHYNPVGRRRIGRRYEGEKEIKGWHLPAKKAK